MTPTPCPSCEEAKKETERLRGACALLIAVRDDVFGRLRAAESALAEVARERDRLREFACLLCRNAPRVEGRSWCVECEPCEKIPVEEALAEARTGRDSALARVAALEGALGEACDLAAEGWGYASDYFREKWGFAERLAALRTVLGRQP